MKKGLILSVMLVCLLALGLMVVGCENNADGSTPPNGPSHFGDNLVLSGQVYNTESDGNYKKFDGNVKLNARFSNSTGEFTATNGKKASITTGLFNYTAGVPLSSEMHNLSTSDFSIIKGSYDNFVVPVGVRGLVLFYFVADNSDASLGRKNSTISKTSGTADEKTMSTDEKTMYVYVDDDVVIKGDGKTTTYGNTTTTTRDFNLELKKGWNMVYSRVSTTTIKTTITTTTNTTITHEEEISTRNPSSLRWVLSN